MAGRPDHRRHPFRHHAGRPAQHEVGRDPSSGPTTTGDAVRACRLPVAAGPDLVVLAAVTGVAGSGSMAGVPDRMWASGGAYEPYVGRWSRLVAERFVAWLDPAPGTRWLDVGCGTGALTGAVLSTAPAAVLALDRSRGYLEHARRLPGAAAGVADASTLPVRDAAVDRVVSGLVLNFLPDPAAAVAEMARACRPGGVVAGYVWDYAEGMQPIRLFWDAAVALDPAAAELDEGRRFPLCRPDRLAAVFAGLADVRSTAITVPTVFRDFGDYWTPFLGGQGPAPTYCAGLPEDARQRLRDRLRSMLADGPIPLSARAWAVRGTVTSTAPAPCT